MPIVPLFAAVLGLVYVALSFYVIGFRRRTMTSLGAQEGNADMLKAIRAHANFAEYVPLALILLWFVESIVFAPALYVLVLCTALLVGRALHIVGILNGTKYIRFRQIGMVLTFLVIIVSSLRIVWYYLPL
jgi:uncharacterized membrane protein YecN with MAPEG domain